MLEINRRNLMQRLSRLAYQALDSATMFCSLRGNPYVELGHWIHQVLQLNDSDLHHILHHHDVDLAVLSADLIAFLDGLPRGSSAVRNISASIDELVERAWVFASIHYQVNAVRTGHLLLAGLATKSLRPQLLALSRQLERIEPDSLARDLPQITEGSPEQAPPQPAAPPSTAPPVAPALGQLEALNRYATDLTARARAGEMDDTIGREVQIRQVIDILMRRRQNNPILTGEAGVGKTAVVEGFAQRIASGDVPPPLKDVAVWSLDIGLLQAGAGVKGEFEKRLRQVAEEVQTSPTPIILFIDEAHTLIGAGGAEGATDAANLLKPALARGTLRTIAATTWAEYKKFIEKDAALTRRFQIVKVDEPTETVATNMLRGISGRFEKHHRVEVADDALAAAVRLSHRYILSRQLPDKAVSLLDTACARVAIGHHAVPPSVDDARARIRALRLELEILQRESTLGVDHAQRADELAHRLADEQARLASLEEQWASERKLIEDLLALRQKLRTADDDHRPALLSELTAAQRHLAQLQGEHPLLLPQVDEQVVASVVADWTGIPVGRMVRNEIQSVLKLADTLEKRVFGQRHALDLIARRIGASRAGLDNPARPVGVFMLVGPSGSGKTETALALAEALYGGEQNLIKLNMAEFQEPHTVSTLKGAPPGYVGYGEGGVLTEAVRRRPYSVVLLDEIEKAHPDVHEIFFEVFDKGHMEDSEGRNINFRNTIILLTSNAAHDVIVERCQQALPGRPDPAELEKAIRPPLMRVFPDALLNRLVVVPYHPLNAEMLRTVVDLNLQRVQQRLAQAHRATLTFDPPVVDLILARCAELDRGARIVESLIANTMLPEIGREILNRRLTDTPFSRVHVTAPNGAFAYALE